MQNLNERVQEFMIKFKELQNEFKISVIPVITQFGPDLMVKDLEEKEEEIVEIK